MKAGVHKGIMFYTADATWRQESAIKVLERESIARQHHTVVCKMTLEVKRPKWGGCVAG